ncbi:MAG: type II toxin-antitoxin system RelE/ParE family toxin [Acidobacteria bacterium]|nr:type II toxin-antitoxin system RelE/ParE family toxin [Acidobacteriota bacterium]
MIQSFQDDDTEAVFLREHCRRFAALARVAKRKLDMIHAATTLDDLRSPPGNRLEPLRANRSGQWSIRINDQWRICFRWEDGEAWDVEIVDYH